MMHKLLLLIGLILLLSACLKNNNEPVATKEGTTNQKDPIKELALISAIDIQVNKAIQDMVTVSVQGSLPTNCSTIEEVTQARSQSTFIINIEVIRQSDPDCLEVDSFFEEIVNLDVSGLPEGTYTVDVNGHIRTFDLQEESEAETIDAVISGQVWHDLCAIGSADPGGAFDPSQGCSEQEPGGYMANGSKEDDEPGIGGVFVDLGQGDCPSTGLAVTITDSDGLYLFSGLRQGSYCVSIDPERGQNTAILAPGNWSYSGDGKDGGQNLTLLSNQVSTDVDFGWDFEFLPLPESIVQNCSDALKFVDDLTVPDGTEMAPGEQFTKTWRLVNSGSCSWTTDYELVFVGGDRMEAPGSVPLAAFVAPGKPFDLTISLVAPIKPGTYRGEWNLRNAEGQLFGAGSRANKPIWIQIIVSE